MDEKKYYPTIIAFQAALAEFRLARVPILDELDISGPCMSILSALYRHGCVSRVELAEVVGLGTNALGRPLDQLIEKQYVARTEDPNNRRYIKLSLTPAGKKLAARYRKLMCQVWDKAFKNFPEHKQELFTEILADMAEVLKEQRKKG